MRYAITLSLLVLTLAAAQARPDERSSTSTPPEAVLDLARQAQDKMTAREWKEAAGLYDQVVRLNPVNADHWYALGAARFNSQDYQGAVPAFEKAITLGAPRMGAYYAVYNLARCHARLGDKELAYKTLERAMALGYPNLAQPAGDPAFSPLREDPRFRKLLWLDDVSKMSRDEGWRYDLAVLASEAHRKGFNPHLYVNRPVSREAFDAKVRELHDAIPQLKDGQIILGMMKLMAFLEDGHTAVWDVGDNPLFKAALPLRMFLFEEGLFVTAADPKHKDLLGAQIVAFDGKPIEELSKALEPYVNRDRHNPMHDKVGLPYRLRRLALLHAAGLIRNPDRVTLQVRDQAGTTRDVEVAADTKEPDIWNRLPAPASWVTFTSTLPNAPLYVRQMNKPYWYEYLPQDKTVYFQYNSIRNDRADPLAAFAERLLKFIDEHDVDKLVIDMRWNNGGDTSTSQPLILGLIGNKKINQRGKLFVIIGRRTYSAAQNTSTYIERYTNATFVGEPTGSSPNFVGEEVPVTLPYSKVMGNVSHLFWQSAWPQDQRIWLAPHIYVAPTFADFRSGRDAALEAILATGKGGK